MKEVGLRIGAFSVATALALAPASVSRAGEGGGAAMPLGGTVLRIDLGLKDTGPADWAGRIELSGGELVRLETTPARAGKVTGRSWKLRSRRSGGRGGKRAKKRPAASGPVLVATLDAPATARVEVSTARGDFSFVLGDVAIGQPLIFLAGQARVERSPLSVRLTATPSDDDWPAAAAGSGGNVWVAYAAYESGPPLDVAAIHNERRFDALVPDGNGDQVRLLRFDGEKWGEPIGVTERRLDVWRPAVAVGGDGLVWVVWSQKVEGNWDLYARSYDPRPGRLGPVRRLSTAPGADGYAVAAADPKSGHVAVVWQGWRPAKESAGAGVPGRAPSGSFDILVTYADVEGASQKRIAASPASEWCPAAAYDSRGTLHVAFDTYERGSYDVKLVSNAAGDEPRTIDVAATERFEARPSVAVDARGRVWVAYEEAGPNWGKDFGVRWAGPSGEQFYEHREVVVRCVEGGRVRQARGVVPAEPIAARYPAGKRRRISLPRVSFDAAGRLWLLYRRHRLLSGAGTIWVSFATYHTGDGWKDPFQLGHSANLLDNRPALVPIEAGPLLIVHSSDGRGEGGRKAAQNDLFCSVARAEGPARAPALIDPPPETSAAAPVHPDETGDIRRMRAYRARIGGTTYRLLRGEFHRHTELTSHRDQDGLLEEIWRYGLDVAAMDWIGDGDHDNGGGREYLWWLVQKQTDFFFHPPRFVPMFTYERSVRYPSGHRNAMFARRGIRPLPRIPGGSDRLFGTPEAGSPDIKSFYAYLKHFGGICASHTSGTNMGTDWRDNDPDVEPVVEIYQGHRQSYEHAGAPASAENAADSIGGYRPAGFVWNALQKGYRLGFEVSSDHVSTHLSYAVVYAREPTREAILDAFRKRHCYGANDNMILDVRCGEKMMGDVFTVRGKPTLEIHAVGTKAVARLSIVRGAGKDVPRYVYDVRPARREVRLRWSDQSPVAGETSYYYVRIEQTPPEGGPGALAWASPMWITVEK